MYTDQIHVTLTPLHTYLTIFKCIVLWSNVVTWLLSIKIFLNVYFIELYVYGSTSYFLTYTVYKKDVVFIKKPMLNFFW